MTTIRSPRLRHVATLPDMIGRQRHHLTVPLIPADFHSIPGTGRGFGSRLRPRLRSSSIRLLTTRFSGSASAVRRPSWLNHLDEQVLPWIADHAVEGVAVLPAAAILEMALAAARWRWPEAPALEVFDVELRRPMPFDKGRMRELRTVLQSDEGEWELASRLRLSSEPLTLNAVARVSAATDARRIISWTAGASAWPPDRRRGPLSASRSSRVSITAPASGPCRTSKSPMSSARSPIWTPRLPATALDPYLLHPALLDGALQALFGLLTDRQHQIQGVGFLPWRFGRVRLPAPYGRVPRRALLRLTRTGVRSVSADIVLSDERWRHRRRTCRLLVSAGRD